MDQRPTAVKFSAQPGDALPVLESVDEVTNRFEEAQGEPFVLTLTSSKPVYVNPDRIACWYEMVPVEPQPVLPPSRS